MKSHREARHDVQRGFAIFCATGLFALAGCGGGGGDPVTSVPPPAPVVPVVSEMTLLAGTIGGVGMTDGAPGRFNQPTGLATDASGNVYVADTGNHTIRKITTAGVTTLAGKPGVVGSTDGTGAAALFNRPVALAVDLSGNVYVVDQSNNVIRKITPAGVVTTIAGSAGSAGNADGTGTNARFSSPVGVAVDASGTVFVAEANQVRKISGGVVTTIATRFNGLNGLAIDGAGNIYVADSAASLIRKITPSGEVTAFAGTVATTNGVAPFGFADGALGIAKFDHPAAITARPDGTLYVLDNSRIRRVTSDGVVSSLLVTQADGAPFVFPQSTVAGIAAASDGGILFTNVSGQVIRKVTPALSVIDVAGTPIANGIADGTGAAARFSGTGALVLDASGNIVVMDASNNAIRKVTTSGVVTTRASSVHPRSDLILQGFGPQLLRGLAIDGSGALFVPDPLFHVVRRIGVDGTTTVVAGTNWPDGVRSGGFLGILIGKSTPVGIAIDSAGTLFVPDGDIIRKVTAAGVDSILSCSNPTTCVTAGKSIDAITIDKADNIYVAQAGVIFKITSSGVSSVLAGGAASRFADGAGTNAAFGTILAMTVDSTGNLFAADTSNNAVRKVTPAGVVTTIAGSPNSIGVVLGPLPGSLTGPAGIVVDSAGTLYVSSENAVLKIRP